MKNMENTTFDWLTRLRSSIQTNKDDPHHRFIQMATVTTTGEPRNRTVVFRGFDDDQESLLFCTDSRSRKVDEFSAFQSTELCWYFLKSREQYRLSGSIHLVQQAHKIQHVWTQLSPQSKAQFYWPSPRVRVIDPKSYSSEVYDHIIDSIQAPEPQPTDLQSSTYPCNFLVIRVGIKSVDYLSLASSYQRFVCKLSPKGWESTEVYP